MKGEKHYVRLQRSNAAGYQTGEIRCYLLGECISDVLDEMEENGDFTPADEEEVEGVA